MHNIHPDLVATDILRVARVLNKEHPRVLTLPEYSKHGQYSKYEMDALGGFQALLKEYFEEPVQPVVEVVQRQSRRRNELAKLRRKLGDQKHFVSTLIDELSTLFVERPVTVREFGFPPTVNEPVERERAVVGFISDIHLGLDINPQEVPCNQYNWEIASRRMAKFAHQLATYKKEHRKDTPTLYIGLGGDLGQGGIHLSEAGTHLITTQLHGGAHIFTAFFDYLLQHFSNIVVVSTPDNHMRMPHKGKGVAREQKFDSFATVLHMLLKNAYREESRITFKMPKTPFSTFEVLGHNFFMTHGDTVIQSGNVGKSVNIERITERINALNNGNTLEKPVDAVLLGHIHVPLYTKLNNGVALVTNGTGSGVDNYAMSIGNFYNTPTQVLFETTGDYPVGDFRMVNLEDADEATHYDKIIPPYRATHMGPADEL